MADEKLIQQQALLMDLIFDNELRQMMDIVPNLPTLDFIADRGRTPLMLAVSSSEEEVVEYLLLRGADPNFPNQKTLPLLAAIERSIEADKYMADMGLEEDEDESPTAILQLLLDYGADFNKKDPSGESAYELARRTNHASLKFFDGLS